MTMNRLPSKYIGLYIEQLEQGGHWFSFENKTGRGTRKLKGWERRFFLIDRRAIPDAMPWRHGDTNFHDDFSINYNANDVARLSEVLVPLRPPLRHLLYVCGLTTACRILELRYDIKIRRTMVIRGNIALLSAACRAISLVLLALFVLFLRSDQYGHLHELPSWTETIVSRGDPIPEARSEARRDDAKTHERPKKKRKVQKHHVSVQSGSEGTLSTTPLNQAESEVVKKSTPHVGTAVVGPHVEKEVVDLRGDTRVPTPGATSHPYAYTEPPVIQKPATSEGHSSQSSHQGHEDEPVSNQYVPNWGLQNDLRVCTFRACRELVSHLATLGKDEFLGGLSNVEVVSRAYQTLGQSVLAQGELSKRHKQLSHNYVDLMHRNDANSEELDCLRLSLQQVTQDNEGLLNKLSLVDSAHSECSSREKELLERLKDLERERDEWRETASSQVERIWGLEKELEPWVQQLVIAEEKIKGLDREKLTLSAKADQAEADRRHIVRDFIPMVIKRLFASVEYRRSLVAPVSLCFTTGWLGGLSLERSEDEVAQKIADSCDLPMDELLKVSPDVPPATDEGNTYGLGAGGASHQPPPFAP
ncbi:hypothetical protein Tco_1163408 [Tanacetum coccineum]